MCKISKELKLSTNDGTQTCDTWAYYRLVEGENDYYGGEDLWMKQLKPEIKQNHKRTICSMLNKSSCFDFVLIPQEEDILQIIFNKNKGSMVFHYFIFSNNKWKTIYITSKEVSYEREVIMYGKITNGLKSPIKRSDFIYDY